MPLKLVWDLQFVFVYITGEQIWSTHLPHERGTGLEVRQQVYISSDSFLHSSFKKLDRSKKVKKYILHPKLVQTFVIYLKFEFAFRFSDWIPYQHRVKANVTDVEGKIKIVPVPPNQVSFLWRHFYLNSSNVGNMSISDMRNDCVKLKGNHPDIGHKNIYIFA